MKFAIFNLVLTLLCVFSPRRSNAQTNVFLAPSNPPPSIQITWDPSLDPSVTNYNIYIGTNGPGLYTQKIAVGTNTLVTLGTNLTRGVTNYFALTETGVTGLENFFNSNDMLSCYVPGPPQLLPTGFSLIVLTVQNSPTFSPWDWQDIASVEMPMNAPSGFYQLQISKIP